MIIIMIITDIIITGPMLHTIHVPVSSMMALEQHVNVVLRNVTRLHRDKQNSVPMSAEDMVGVTNVKSIVNSNIIVWCS